MDGEQQRRRARRAFIRAHHPDRGGDPAAFTAGLAALNQSSAAELVPRVIVVADVRWPARVITALRRRAGWRRPPPRVR